MNTIQHKRPFVTSHRRKDGLTAMLLSIVNGQVLYRVEWFDNNKRHENTLERSQIIFDKLFRKIVL